MAEILSFGTHGRNKWNNPLPYYWMSFKSWFQSVPFIIKTFVIFAILFTITVPSIVAYYFLFYIKAAEEPIMFQGPGVTRDSNGQWRTTSLNGLSVKLTSPITAPQNCPEDNTKRLGTQVGSGDLGRPQFTNTLRNYGYTMLTIEALKMGWLIETTPDTLQQRLGPAEAVANFAAQNGMKARGHTLYYPDATPSWVNGLTHDEMLTFLDQYFTNVIGHFNPCVVTEWDVVNEALDENYPNYELMNTPFKQKLGDHYMDILFQKARAAADKKSPNIKLFYNEDAADGLGPKSDKIYQMVTDMKARGVPIDGVGFQAHTYNMSPDVLRTMKDNLMRFSNAGFDVRITEMEVAVTDGSHQLTPQDLQNQAYVYGKVAQICSEVPRCKGITTWQGPSDNEATWIDGVLCEASYPNHICPVPNPKHFYTQLIDTSYNPKLAYFAVADALGISYPGKPTPTPSPLPTTTPLPPTLTPTPGAPTGTISISPTSCIAPCTATVSWQTQNSPTASVYEYQNYTSGDVGVLKSNALSGSYQVTLPAGTHHFNLFKTPTSGTATDLFQPLSSSHIEFTVSQPAATPTPPCPVYVRNTSVNGSTMTVTLTPAATNPLSQIQFTSITNATVSIGNLTNQSAPFSYALPNGSTPTSFTFTKITSGQQAQVNLRVTDSCSIKGDFYALGAAQGYNMQFIQKAYAQNTYTTGFTLTTQPNTTTMSTQSEQKIQPYTGNGMVVPISFSDTAPGVKTVSVTFYGKTGERITKTASIVYQPVAHPSPTPTPTVSQTTFTVSSPNRFALILRSNGSGITSFSNVTLFRTNAPSQNLVSADLRNTTVSASQGQKVQWFAGNDGVGTFTFSGQVAGDPGVLQVDVWSPTNQFITTFKLDTPPPPPTINPVSLTASPNPCQILPGQPYCTSKISWDIKKPVPEGVIIKIRSTGQGFAGGAPTGSADAWFVTQNGVTLDMYTGNTLLSSITVKGNPPITPTTSQQVQQVNKLIETSVTKAPTPLPTKTAVEKLIPSTNNPIKTTIENLLGRIIPSPTAIPIVKPTATPIPKFKYIFVTKATYTGNLGGQSGADEKCQAEATTAKLSGTYKAWLSGITAAGNRIQQYNLPYVLPKGTIVANTWTDLTDGELANPINKAADNTTITGLVWTNTKTGGAAREVLNSCVNWTSNSKLLKSYTGIAGTINSLWTSGFSDTCNQLRHLYCVQQ